MNEHEDNIRELIKEILGSNSIEEFSGVANISPMLPMPLGRTTDSAILNRSHKKRSKKKRNRMRGLKEGFGLTLHNLIRYELSYDEYEFEETESYYDALNKLLSSFAGSENPFGLSKNTAVKNIDKYLKGHLNYPHGT